MKKILSVALLSLFLSAGFAANLTFDNNTIETAIAGKDKDKKKKKKKCCKKDDKKKCCSKDAKKECTKGEKAEEETAE